MSASTVSQHVQSLLEKSLIEEGPGAASSGGRRPRELHLVGNTALLGMIDLGGAHARLGIARRGGGLTATTEIPISLGDGADRVLTQTAHALRKLADGTPLAGAGIALPGPVGIPNRGVSSPSRMPGWGGVDIAALFEAEIGVPVVVENDANAMALGEHFARSPRATNSVTIKAGTAIGAGIVIDGHIFRGAIGTAGEITHTRVEAAGALMCSCGNRGCLETVSSGAALVRLLREKGLDVSSTADVLTLVRNADPEATALAHTAGQHLGEVMCAVVNFFNPDAIYLGGALSTLEPFVSAIRSQIYEGAHPLMTRDLDISPALLGADASLVGTSREINESLARESTD